MFTHNQQRQLEKEAFLIVYRMSIYDLKQKVRNLSETVI